MATTTDPRPLTAGNVRVSPTNAAKRDALIGRFARGELATFPGATTGNVVVGIITTVQGLYPVMTVVEGALTGRTMRLDSTVRLVESTDYRTTRAAAVLAGEAPCPTCGEYRTDGPCPNADLYA